MVQKKFCDGCNVDITGEPDYQAEIYDMIAEKEIIQLDLCEPCMKELKKHLVPGGYIHIEVPDINDPLVGLYDIVKYRNFFYKRPHLYYFDPHTLKKVVEKARLEIVSLVPFQQTSLTNHLNWIYRKQPQPCRWDCILSLLPANYLSSDRVDKTKKRIDKFFQKMNTAYKDILLESGFTDNIFCTLKKTIQ